MKRPFKFRSDYGPVLSPDGQHVATFVRDVTLFDVESRKKVWKAHPFSYPSELAFDSSGQKLAVKSLHRSNRHFRRHDWLDAYGFPEPGRW